MKFSDITLSDHWEHIETGDKDIDVIRFGKEKITFTYPKNADVVIDYIPDVRTRGEAPRPVENV